MVHIGARLARRFTLLSAEQATVPDLERFIAHDSRLQRHVRVDVITALAPSAVRNAAAAAARIRDPRLLRVLASGRERIDEDSFTYVVTDLPEGKPLTDLLARRLVPSRIAGTIVGDAARALAKASAQGVHHGYLRSSSITVTRSGMVIIAGLGTDGELAMQAGIGRGASESSDAMALGRLYLSAITGLDADEATERDLPADLGVRGRKLCMQVINGSGPLTLESVLRSLAPVDSRILSDFPALVRAMPLLPERPSEDYATTGSGELEDVHLDVGPDVAESPEERPDAEEVPLLLPLPRVEHDEHPEVEEALGANELHDLYEFDEMVAVQDVNNTTSTWEALLARMHRRWPGSKSITHTLERAHKRANRSGPIWVAPILIPLLAITVLLLTMFAWSALKAPLDDHEDRTRPPNSYPIFTNSPEPTVSPSASPNASPPAKDG